VVDYLPTWVELSVTLGIFSLGVTVISWLIRAALIIEERYVE
jgi:molybdopterin-containing oxidoreductase family membrane subunit